MQDKDLARLAQRPDLTNLDLQSSEITDAGLAHLANLNSLKRLHLGHTQVTAAGLRHLVGLDNLTDLDLTGSQVVLEDAVEHLKKMPSLRWLDLRMLRGRSIPTHFDAIDELKAALPNVSFHHLGLRPYLLPARRTERASGTSAAAGSRETDSNAAPPEYVLADLFEDQMPVVEEYGQYYGEKSGLSYLLCGIRRCGVVDKVPGHFFVATEFLHLFRIPLLPTDTYLYRKDSDWDLGFSIPLSFKSVLYGWVRGLLGLTVPIALLVVFEAAVFSSEIPGFLLRVIIGLVVLLTCGGLYAVTKIAARPTLQRAEKLARKLRMPIERFRQVQQIVKAGRWSGDSPASELVHCAQCGREIAATTRVCPRCETRQF